MRHESQKKELGNSYNFSLNTTDDNEEENLTDQLSAENVFYGIILAGNDDSNAYEEEEDIFEGYIPFVESKLQEGNQILTEYNK